MYSNKTTKDITVIHGQYDNAFRENTNVLYACVSSIRVSKKKQSKKTHRQVLHNVRCKHQATQRVVQNQHALTIYQ